ncbi:hypothetical protein [Kribbella sp. NPDC051770]|uniref:hypothetical protein n=1 Tax=Kribbella sp. NPDC051770 TaxID=3155413 RepID=UPI003435361E
MLRLAVAALAVAALTGCSATGQPAATGLQLTATLTSPVDITLDWSGTPDAATSTIVEFATEQDGQYTILNFLGPDQHTFQHPDLMPKTPFYYRVTPVLGPASEAVAVQLPSTTIFRAESKQAQPGSVRAEAGTPTDVAVKSAGGDLVRVTWKDNATDEEGFLLEIKPDGQPAYRVAGFIDPGTTFTELSTLPSERKASYRIRAFYRGPASNLAHQTTGGTL